MTTNTDSDSYTFRGSGIQGDAITFCSAGEEVLKLSHKGCWINGKLIDDTEQGRLAVYEAFKSWLVFQRISQQW